MYIDCESVATQVTINKKLKINKDLCKCVNICVCVIVYGVLPYMIDSYYSV